MPAIARGSGGRSRRRNPSPTQDGIEEVDTTQRSRGDDVEDVDAEEQPPPRRGSRAARVKAGKVAAAAENGASGSRRRQANGANGVHRAGAEEESASYNGVADEEEDEDNIINVDDFGDHPLRRSDMPQISGMAQNEWESLERNVKNSIFKLAKDIGAVFADASEVRGEIGEEVSTIILPFQNFGIPAAVNVY